MKIHWCGKSRSSNAIKPGFKIDHLFHGSMILLCLQTQPLLAKDPLSSPALKSKIKGLVISELEVENFKNGETNHEGRLEFDTERHRGFEAEFELRARTKDNEVDVRKALINRKLDQWSLEFGYGKKRFGAEYQLNKRERLTIARSPIYRRLEIFTYAGRETYLRFYRDSKRKSAQSGLNFMIGQSEAQNLSLISGIDVPFGDDWNWGSWALLQSRKAQEGRQFNWSVAQALSYQTNLDRFEAELIGGIDPDESEFTELTGKDRNVYFWGIKSHYGRRFFIEDGEAWEPLVQASYLIFDTNYPRLNSFQFLLGANYYILPIRVSLNLELIGTNRQNEKPRYTYDESSGRFEVSFEF